MQSILKKSTNVFKTNGYVQENGLKVEPCDIKLKDENGNDNGTIKGERVMGQISIKNDCGVMTYHVYAQNLRPNGEENTMYGMYKDMVSWAGQNSTEGPTLVHLEGNIAPNDYVNTQNKVVSTLRYNVNRGNTRSVDPENLTTQLTISGMVSKIYSETRNEEETGRLIAEMTVATSQGTCFPVNIIIDDDYSEVFEQQVEVNDTIEAVLLVNNKLVGQSTQKRTMVAKKNFKAMSNASYVTELIFAEGSVISEPEEVYDDDGNLMETNSLWINPKVMRKAMNERTVYLENLAKNPPVKKTTTKPNTNTSMKAKKQAAEKMPDFTSLSDDDDDLGF